MLSVHLNSYLPILLIGLMNCLSASFKKVELRVGCLSAERWYSRKIYLVTFHYYTSKYVYVLNEKCFTN